MIVRRSRPVPSGIVTVESGRFGSVARSLGRGGRDGGWVFGSVRFGRCLVGRRPGLSVLSCPVLSVGSGSAVCRRVRCSAHDSFFFSRVAI